MRVFKDPISTYSAVEGFVYWNFGGNVEYTTNGHLGAATIIY